MSSVVFDTDPAVFAAEIVPLLAVDEAANGLMLGIADWLARTRLPDGGVLLRVVDAGVTRAAGLRVPPHNIVLSPARAVQIDAIVTALVVRGIEFPGVNGPAETVSLFEAAWHRATGKTPTQRIDEVLYRLDRVAPVQKTPGRMRIATDIDLALVREWIDAFIAEALPNDPSTPASRTAIAERRIRSGEIFLWERDDVPVGIAGYADSRNGARITNVYTPPALRGQGIATTLVGFLSETLLARGKLFCFLYVDAANPVSAHVYENIGYRRVCEMRHTDYT